MKESKSMLLFDFTISLYYSTLYHAAQIKCYIDTKLTAKIFRTLTFENGKYLSRTRVILYFYFEDVFEIEFDSMNGTDKINVKTNFFLYFF